MSSRTTTAKQIHVLSQQGRNSIVLTRFSCGNRQLRLGETSREKSICEQFEPLIL